MIHIPAGVYAVYTDPTINWSYETEDEPELNGRNVYTPRGKVVGGSSSINSMVYMRGHPRDYDRWAGEFGLERWTYDQCLPYFKAGEASDRGADDWRGADGPARGHVSRSPEPAVRCLPRRGRAGGAGTLGRSERLPAGGRGPAGQHEEARPPLQRRGRAPQARDGAEEPAPRNARHGPPHHHRRESRRGNRVSTPRRDSLRPRGSRGHSLGRRHQLAPAHDGLRHRAGRPPALGRHRAEARPAGRRPEPPGPSDESSSRSRAPSR